MTALIEFPKPVHRFAGTDEHGHAFTFELPATDFDALGLARLHVLNGFGVARPVEPTIEAIDSAELDQFPSEGQS